MKFLIDVSRAVTEGIITPTQGENLKRAAAANTTTLAIGILLSFGVIAVSVGVLALEPSINVVIVLGIGIAGGGLIVQMKLPSQWGFLGLANVLVGALMLSGGILLKWHGHPFAFLAVCAILLALGMIARSGLLVALAVFALAGFLGSTTGYRHAAYALWVREPTVTIIVFSGLSLLGLVSSKQLPPDYQGLANVVARLSLIWVNFGFWVGSLWGDYPLASWLHPESFTWMATEYRARGLVHIPDEGFAGLWAVVLLAVGIWGAKQNRRYVVNTTAVFGAIHFYTQWFERLHTSPSSIIIAGVIAIAASTALWRYNQLRTRPPN